MIMMMMIFVINPPVQPCCLKLADRGLNGLMFIHVYSMNVIIIV